MNVGIVGCGGIARVHAQCVAALDGHRLVAFADVKPERARAMAGEYGGAAFASMDEMLDSARPDAVHICAPHHLHVPMAVAALARGIHVFMEKPPVIDEGQHARLRDAVRNAASAKDRRPARLGVCFQNRYNPAVAEVRGFLASGKAGSIRGGRAFVTWSRVEDYYAGSDWRGRLATEGGGALINQSIHTLDLLNCLMGRPPIGVGATMANHHLPPSVEVEDTLEAFVRYDGAVASFYATTAYSSDAAPLIELDCECARIRLEGDRVTYSFNDGSGETLVCPSDSPLGKGYWGAGHLRCIGDFYGCLERNEKFPLDFDGVESIIRLMLATYCSARSGQFLPV